MKLDGIPDGGGRKTRALWWLIATLSVAIGGYGMALQDARQVTDAVPGLPWLDEVHFVGSGLALAVANLGLGKLYQARGDDVSAVESWQQTAELMAPLTVERESLEF